MTEPYYQDEKTIIHHGDCLEVMADMPAESIDAIVTDPPYGLGFMGNKWDHMPPGKEWAEACLRVLKPGGHLLAFGGSRTWHRLAVAIEDGGFEIRDSLAWLYGSGFPKSLDVSKAIDKQRHDADDKLRVTQWLADVAERNGVTRADVDAHMGTSDMGGWWLSRLRHRCAIPTLDQVPRLLDVLGVAPDDVPDEIRALLIDLNGMKGQPGPAWFAREITQAEARPLVSGETISFDQRSSKERERRDIPATPDAERWQGWGTALKPAFEPVVVARKPFTGTVAANVLEHGTGALNIDACRIGMSDDDRAIVDSRSGAGDATEGWGNIGKRSKGQKFKSSPSGRWPANVVLDESQAAALDEQSGTLVSGKMQPTHTTAAREVFGQNASGGYTTMETYGDSGGASRFFYCAKAPKSERPKVDGVAHPTVKPLTLMRWLVRLVTPPGGTVLDPFAGSGTTIEAALTEGFNSIGIELTDEYLSLIQRRIERATETTMF